MEISSRGISCPQVGYYSWGIKKSKILLPKIGLMGNLALDWVSYSFLYDQSWR